MKKKKKVFSPFSVSSVLVSVLCSVSVSYKPVLACAGSPYVLGYKPEQAFFVRTFEAPTSLKTWSLRSVRFLPEDFKYVGKSQMEKLINEDKKEMISVRNGSNVMSFIPSMEGDGKHLLVHKGGVLGSTTSKTLFCGDGTSHLILHTICRT
jgi:hypothetical protein